MGEKELLPDPPSPPLGVLISATARYFFLYHCVKGGGGGGLEGGEETAGAECLGIYRGRALLSDILRGKRERKSIGGGRIRRAVSIE